MEMPEPRTVKIEVLPEGEGELFYLDRFMAEFGAGRHEAVELNNLVPYRRIVSEDLFTNHQTDRPKVKKRGRGPYVLFVAEAIKRPDEIWISKGSHHDRTLFSLARFNYGKDTLHIVTAFKEKSCKAGQDSVWIGWSGYKSDAPEKYNEKRKGEIIYRRP